MITHEYRHLSAEHIRRYHGLSFFEASAIFLAAEKGVDGHEDLNLRLQGPLNFVEKEVLDTVSVTHRSYNSLRYVLSFPFGGDARHIQLASLPLKNSFENGVGNRGKRIT